MTNLSLPTPPSTAGLANVQAADVLGAWLLNVARRCGEPALDHATTAGWPGTPEQRALLAPGHIEQARNEARQLANETWAMQAKARGAWGV